MRLCLISHAYLEDAYSHVLETLSAYPGIELAWITPKRYKLNLQTSSGEVSSTKTSFRTYAIPIHLGGRQGTFIYSPSALSQVLDEFQPDVIFHEQEVYCLGATQIAHAAQKRKVPLVMFVYENVYRSLSWPRRFLTRYVLRSSKGLIATNHGAVDVHRFWGFQGRATLLPQIGVKLDPSPSFGPRSESGLEVCYAGRLIPSKGVDCLLQAIAVLHHEGLSIRCTVAGKGESREDLIALARKLGIGHVVVFVGMLLPEELKLLLRRSDVLVCPSRRTATWEEQFGRVLVEAMAQGTITAGSRTGAIGEVIGSDDLLFDEDDFAALAMLLRKLARDPQCLEFHQRRSWARARDYYEDGIVTQNRVDFLREIVRDADSGTQALPA